MELFIGFFIAGIVACFIYNDAKARGMNAAGWAIGTLCFTMVALPLYLIVCMPLIVK
jgi:4-amino-4-deoxy-L-arabinose transferase-like glycosyltransferase